MCVCFQDVGYFILASVVLVKKTKQKTNLTYESVQCDRKKYIFQTARCVSEGKTTRLRSFLKLPVGVVSAPGGVMLNKTVH